MMKAIKMCQRVKEKIDSKTSLNGYIHSVFDRACNILEEEDNLISILFNDKPMYPLSITIENQNSFLGLGINHGTEVIINDKQIVFRDLDLEIDLTDAEIWSGKFVVGETPVSEKDVIEKLYFIENYIYQFGNHGGLAPLIFNLETYIKELKPFKELDLKMNFYCLFILEKFLNFITTVKTGDKKEISKATNEIIGFGPGLTPSIDDLISGFMLALIYLGSYYGHNTQKAVELNRAIINGVGDRTTKISKKMLEFASYGETSEDINMLLKTIFYKPINNNFNKRIANILSLGETSGTDLLCGIYLGCKIMLNKNNRGIL